MAAGLTWSSSRNALPLWSSGSPLLRGTLGKGELAERAAALRQSLDGTDPAAFARAVESEVAGRLAALADGIEAYRRHPYRRDQIGRASCRERVCQYVEISVVAVYLKKKKDKHQNILK